MTKEQLQAKLQHGTVYTLEEFNVLKESGILTPENGIGYLHTGRRETPETTWGKEFYFTTPKKTPFVVWYKRYQEKGGD